LSLQQMLDSIKDGLLDPVPLEAGLLGLLELLDILAGVFDLAGVEKLGGSWKPQQRGWGQHWQGFVWRLLGGPVWVGLLFLGV
jgi:hypothetical protein